MRLKAGWILILADSVDHILLALQDQRTVFISEVWRFSCLMISDDLRSGKISLTNKIPARWSSWGSLSVIIPPLHTKTGYLRANPAQSN